MNIGPVELQVIIPKATEVGKVQNQLNQQAVLTQDQNTEQWQHIAANRRQQVQTAEKSSGGVIRRKPEGERHHREQQQPPFSSSRAKSPTKKNEQNDTEDPLRGHLLDIRT